MTDNYASTWITAPDGLQLYVRDYGPRRGNRLSVFCLAGLSRSSVDFHPLATALSTDAASPRRVLALDYRGRGRSDYDPNAENYAFPVELADVMAALTALELGTCVFIGTSRGGLLTMLLATARPTAIAGVVLNDIGPVIEPKGLLRIKGYVGKMPRPRNYAEGAEILRRLFDAQFSKLGPEDWLAFAKRSYKETANGLEPDYDVRLAKTLEGAGLERPPALWAAFDALADVPMMVIRGANSDLLSPTTVETMRERRPDLEFAEIPDQGHAPLLAEPDIIGRIAAFIRSCDQATRQV